MMHNRSEVLGNSLSMGSRFIIFFGAVLVSLSLFFAFLSPSAHAADLPGDGVQSVSTASGTTCAVRQFKAYCWGGNLSTNGTTSNSPQQVNISGKTVDKISVGNDHACALAEATVYCWGENGQGQLGNGTTTSSNTPVAAKRDGALKSKEIIDIATGDGFTCALSTDSTTACWGNRANGRIGAGNGMTGKELNPKSIDADSALAGKKALRLATASSATMCIIAADSGSTNVVDGSVYCWGFGIDNGSNATPGSGSRTECRTSAPASQTVYFNSDRPVLITGAQAKSIVGQIGNIDTTGTPTTGYMSAVGADSRASYWGRAGYAVSYAQAEVCTITTGTPDPVCPAGQTGTYPNCQTPVCPAGQTGTYPNCQPPACPAGQTGTYPNCRIATPVCTPGYTYYWAGSAGLVNAANGGAIPDRIIHKIEEQFQDR